MNIEPKKKKKKRGQVTLYWQPLVLIWFEVYAELIPPPPGEEKAKPCFDTVETAQMKIILRELRKRAEDKNVEWTEDEAKKRWDAFLRHAFLDDWISKNFMLRIISTNKTKIFNNQITPKKDGTGQRENNFGNSKNRTASTSDSKIRALSNWGLGSNKNYEDRQED